MDVFGNEHERAVRCKRFQDACDRFEQSRLLARRVEHRVRSFSPLPGEREHFGEQRVERIEPHRLNVPRGERSNAVLEPLLTDQWFVDIKPLAVPAVQAVLVISVLLVVIFNLLVNVILARLIPSSAYRGL